MKKFRELIDSSTKYYIGQEAVDFDLVDYMIDIDIK